MLEIKNWEVFGLERSLLAAKNPMSIGPINTMPVNEDLGPKVEDLERGTRLGSVPSGTAHDNYLSGILVTFDIKYPEYWSPEFQRYHFAQIISSQSKIHRLTSITKIEDFNSLFNDYVDLDTKNKIKLLVDLYNEKDTKRTTEEQYSLYMRILSNLPMGFEKWMTVTTNFLQLKTIYLQRRNHKLKEWHIFCDWIENLPYFRQLTGIKNGI